MSRFARKQINNLLLCRGSKPGRFLETRGIFYKELTCGMTPISIPLTPLEMEELREGTEYEAWLLEAVYEIVDQRLPFEGLDEIVYPPNGGPAKHTNYAIGNCVFGDWRPGFLRIGAPLVFVTTFKVLDMLIEWVLTKNGKTTTHRFKQKIQALKGPVLFPTLIETRPWLRQRVVALYEALEPLRGTIIHARHFKTSEGTLRVSCSKGGRIGPEIVVSEEDLRNLALALVSLLRYLDGTWAMDIFREKHLRCALDELTHLHGLPSLGQLSPGFLTVRLFVSDEDPIKFDISKLRAEVAEKRKGQDVIFDVRVVAVARDGARATAYLVPWDLLEDSGSQFSMTRDEISTYIVPLPNDFDLPATAREMRLKP